MRLRSLTLRAVGPFADEHRIDFDALATSGLFLLEGPTGSGKSTLIDAIVFALYGKVASADASDERLRSAYAPDDVESVVDLVFEVPGGVFRVRRTPQYQRAKKRGTGTTTAQATVKAWRLPADVDPGAGPDVLDAVGVPLGNRLDEVGAELQRLVGLDRQQFVQTIVLPQGEFARFLRANPEDRRGLLQKIFGTEVYERLQVRLAELRREHERSVEAARASLDRSVAHLVGAASLDDEQGQALRDAAGSAHDDVEHAVRAAVTARTAALEARSVEAAEVAALAERVAADARSALEGETALAALLARRTALRSERDLLAGRACEHEQAVARLAAARAARTVGPVLLGADSARTALAAARKALRAALDAAPDELVTLVGDPEGVGVTSARTALEAERDRTVRLEGTLRRLVEVEAGLDAERHRVRAARDAIDDACAVLVTHDAWIVERPAARAVLVGSLATARQGAALVGEREAAVAAAEACVTTVEDLIAARREHGRAESARRAAAVTATQALEHERALRAARIAGLAGELASTLVAGDACPVCGAVEHPAKAVVGADHVRAEQVETAEQDRAAAEAALAACAQDAVRWTERIAAAEQALAASTLLTADDPEAGSAHAADGDRDPGRLAVATRLLESARAALDEARAAVDLVARLEQQLGAFDHETGARQAERVEVATALAAAEAALDAQVDALDQHEAEVVEARGEYPTVAARHGELTERADAAQDLLDALADLAAAHDDDARRTAELASALDEHGFATPDDARQAHLDPAGLAALERAVADHETALGAVAAGLAEPEVATLAEDATADVDAARAHESVARQAAQQAAAEARSAQDRARAGASAAATVLLEAAALQQRAAEARPVARLASLASGIGGDNSRHLSLATYVLVRRFEDVVAAANERLLTMSDGRYELVRSDEKEDVRTRATGLAMRVVDHLTEQPRDPRSLSGGETFYVSLCLALGMADVVTAEAGGIDLGTLFVDEGFGSLDPHVLDQVLAELGRLRAGGRVVGLVSHVETLKQAVADRIEVRPTGHGPSTVRVLAS